MLFCLAGCTGKTPPTPQLDFTSEISVSLGEDTNFLKGNLVSSSQGTLSLEITTPDEIRGLTYKWRDNLNVSLQDISVEVDKGYFPKTSVPSALYNVLFHVHRSGEFQGFDGDIATFTGRSESGDYTLKTDSKGKICEISLEEINIKIKFEYKQK